MVARAILCTLGTPQDLAQFVGDSLVDANLAGHDSHGVLLLPSYVRAVRAGDVRPAMRPVVVERHGATARIDGAWGWGQPAMMLATETAIALGRESGIGVAIVDRCWHVGRIAPYVETIARAGLVGIAMVNTLPLVAPFGGRTRVLGTNPIAWAVPRGARQEPISFDAATSGIAGNKVRLAQAKGELVPPGFLLDGDGRPTQDPDALFRGGALLTFGGYKGYALSVLVQVLGRGLMGIGATGYDGPQGANGPLVFALNPTVFVPLDIFTSEVDAQCAALQSAPPADGVEAVLLPGQPELAIRCRRGHEGIPIPERFWNELLALSEELGVACEGIGSEGAEHYAPIDSCS
jgi:LDH2 family malate/lactate/ureidoglycolate dehydrogenase